MKKKFIILSVCVFFTQVMFAQLRMDTNGNVGIQIGTGIPLSSLSIGGVGSTNSKVDITGSIIGLNALSTGTVNVGNWTYGIVGTSHLFSNMHIGVIGQCYAASPLNTKRAFGVLGVAGNSSSGYNYGVFGTTYGSQYGAGIVGTTGNNRDVNISDGVYAGYFVGNVKVTGLINGITVGNSDSRYKKNIANLENKKTLNNVLQMLPVEYNLNQIYTKSTGDSIANNKGLYNEESQMFKKKHYGLIAQDLQAIYPDLVYEDDNGYLSVNYTGIIPLLIESIKELNTELETIKTKTATPTSPNKIKSNGEVDDTNALTYPILEQNIPNPFNTTTSIGFYLPGTIGSASVYVYNMNGVQLKNYSISERGKGTVTIQGSEFNAGMYLYALIADGKVIDTKRMILTK